MQRTRVLQVGVVCLFAAAMSACGSKQTLGSILAPTENAAVTGVTLTLSTPPLGGTVQANAIATFSTGGTVQVTTGFSSDSPGVATTTAGGRVTGLTIGDVTISVEYFGVRATKKVRVLPGYAGLFSGTYVVSGCVQTDGFAAENFCSPFTTGLVLPIDFSHDQSPDLTTLTGQFRLGTSIGNGVGVVLPTGVLTYNGGLTGTTRQMDFRNWSGTSPSPGRITGSFEMVWTDSAVTGSAVLTCVNMDMTRQSSSLNIR